MRIVYDARHIQHQPRTEIMYGRLDPHPERPERVEAIRQVLAGTRWDALVQAPLAYPLELAATVHEAAYVAHLQARAIDAAALGPEGEWFPYTWPRDRALDTGTPVMELTPALAWHSACVALTGADLLLACEPAAYALCRPPGHHAAAGALGGYCYFNNAALAAARLLGRGRGSGIRGQGRFEPDVEQARAGERGISRAEGGASLQPARPIQSAQSTYAGQHGVAILDLDIHHGNGTQDIFYQSDQVLYCSIHGEPEWAYPPHCGFADETGGGVGQGFTFNQPLPEGTGWETYREALDRALERIARFGPSHVVLSQGFDTFAGDRWGGFLLQAEHFARIGELVRAVGVPVLAVLEGGYEPANLAAGSLSLLEGLDG